MKKFLSSVSLAAMAFGFTLQGSHAMNPLDKESGQGMKRVLPVDQEGNPEIPSTNDIPFSTDNFIPESLTDILPNMLSRLPKNKKWELRLVCQNWNRIIASCVETLDLSSRVCTPLGRRKEVMDSLVGGKLKDSYVFKDITFFKAYLFGHMLKKNDQFSKVCFKSKNNSGWLNDIKIIEDGFPIIEVEENDFWNSDRWDTPDGEGIKNPLREEVTNVVVDLRPFLNLLSLTLNGNTAISDKNLSQASNLRSLSLSDTPLITDQSVSLLTNLTTLDLTGQSIITEKALAHLTNLTEL